MTQIIRKLKKLKGRSLAELRVRGAQSLSAHLERRSLSPQSRVPADAEFRNFFQSLQAGHNLWSAEGFLEHFRRRSAPAFFPSFSDQVKTVSVLRQFGAEHESLTVERANRICRGSFDLLGLCNLNFGNPIDWHLEPLSGKRTPLAHWSRINFLDPEVAGDKKITWELNRHQYFMTLGRAYWLTGDEKFARTFVAHLESWMDDNPPKSGINWASSLEVSLRAIAWLWAFHFFKNSPHLNANVLWRALKFLYLSGRHLETYLSTYFSPNTHLTGEALGLFYLGTMLPEFRHAARWRTNGKRILLEQLERHVKPDGVYFEQTSYYHRYTADFYTHLYILAHANGDQMGGQLEEKLKLLLDHLMYITRPDGTTPFFGDDDGGKLVMLGERQANDFRDTLATGAAIFKRSDYKYVAGSAPAEETLWLLGDSGLQTYEQLEAHPPSRLSVDFPDGGYYVMRDGWSSQDNYLLIDCGPHGADNCGHAHADALSFELSARGRTLLVDPGTYTYTGSAQMRNSFRSSQAHNTLVLDGQSSSVPNQAFTWNHIAKCFTRSWLSCESFDFFAGEHDGYARLSTPAVHIRSVLFLKGGYFIIRDHVASDGPHNVSLHFNFDAGVETSLSNEDGQAKAAALFASGAELNALEIFSFADNLQATRRDGWISRCYGERLPAPVAVFSAATHGAADLITFLIPGERDDKEVVQLECAGGLAFEVRAGRQKDVVIINQGQDSISAGGAASDFEWTWMRLTSEPFILEKLVGVGQGKRVTFDDQTLVDSRQSLDYLTARRLDDGWRIEASNDEVAAFVHSATALVS